MVVCLCVCACVCVFRGNQFQVRTKWGAQLLFSHKGWKPLGASLHLALQCCPRQASPIRTKAPWTHCSSHPINCPSVSVACMRACMCVCCCSLFLSVSLSPSLSLSACLPACVSVCLSVCQSVSLSVCMCVPESSQQQPQAVALRFCIFELHFWGCIIQKQGD